MHARIALGILLVGFVATSLGCHAISAGTGLPMNHHLPPANRIMHPGPGVGGPGPGVIPPMPQYGISGQPAAEAQVWFNQPEGLQVRWDVTAIGQFDSEPLITPGRSNFPQGGIYRLKLTNVPERPGVELYPTLEIGPATSRTSAYLAHNAIPVEYTDEDFDQVLSGNMVTKVIYLPDPEYQNLAVGGVGTLVSTRLDAGDDPIKEADRRGAILAIVRLGNKDLEMPTDDNGEAIAPAAYNRNMASRQPYAMPALPYDSPQAVPNYISGVTAPHYGMPMSGTPIGLAGPPHIPHGIPAGLQSHSMYNHTHMHIPGPTKHMWFHLKQAPGFSYPAPANKIYVHERTHYPHHWNRQPPHNMLHYVPGSAGGANVVPGQGGAHVVPGHDAGHVPHQPVHGVPTEAAPE